MLSNNNTNVTDAIKAVIDNKFDDLIVPIFFWFDPEKVHYFTFSIIRIVSKIPGFSKLAASLERKSEEILSKESKKAEAGRD